MTLSSYLQHVKSTYWPFPTTLPLLLPSNNIHSFNLMFDVICRQIFSSDSENENPKEKSKSRRKKHKSSSGLVRMDLFFISSIFSVFVSLCGLVVKLLYCCPTFQVRTHYFEGNPCSPVLAEFYGVPEEEENAGAEIQLSAAQC